MRNVLPKYIWDKIFLQFHWSCCYYVVGCTYLIYPDLFTVHTDDDDNNNDDNNNNNNDDNDNDNDDNNDNNDDDNNNDDNNNDNDDHDNNDDDNDDNNGDNDNDDNDDDDDKDNNDDNNNDDDNDDKWTYLFVVFVCIYCEVVHAAQKPWSGQHTNAQLQNKYKNRRSTVENWQKGELIHTDTTWEPCKKT